MISPGVAGAATDLYKGRPPGNALRSRTLDLTVSVSSVFLEAPWILSFRGFGGFRGP